MKLIYNDDLVVGKSCPKMQNLFARYQEDEDKGTPRWMKYNEEEFKVDAFGYVTDGWVYTEKIDGMNLRIKLEGGNGHIEWRLCGRSDKAEIPQDLLVNVEKMLAGMASSLHDALQQGPVTLYGEGYGPGIQKGGGDYRDEKGFVLFDVWVHEMGHGDYEEGLGFFMPWATMCMWAEDVGLKVVEEYCTVSLDKLVGYLRNGFLSMHALKRQAEGIVARQRNTDLYFYDGGSMKRLMFKLKTKDFVPSLNPRT